MGASLSFSPPTTRSLVPSLPQENKRSPLRSESVLLTYAKLFHIRAPSLCRQIHSELRQNQLKLTATQHLHLELVELVHLPLDYHLLRQPILPSPSSLRILERPKRSSAGSHNLQLPHLVGQQTSAETDQFVDGCWSSYALAWLYTSGEALKPPFQPSGSTIRSSVPQTLPHHLITTQSNGSPKTRTTNTP